jgi:Na+/H+ antiporter NhaD/arsenite permease-like protein
MQAIVAAIIFLLVYAAIVSERVNRTLAALAGAVLVIGLGVVNQEEAFRAIDLNVIFLLVGMMVIAGIIGETGVFQWMAVQAVRVGRGRPFPILVVLCLVTALTSALLDNVTVVILIAPVTLYIASHLRLSPVIFLIAETLAANIGGAATVIGDPPNILIASAAGLDFLTFAGAMLPAALLNLAATLGVLYALSRVEWRDRPAGRAGLDLDARSLITNLPLLRKALVVMALALVGFGFHGVLHLEVATIALAAATLLLLWTRRDPHPCFGQIEWTTLFFFVGLFILVEGLVKVGLIARAADAILSVTGGDLRLTSTALLWFSTLVSGFVDNIPYTATMLPLVESLGQAMPAGPLWWALAMGADFGGNLTLVGASANIVIAAIAERAGHPLTFRSYLKYGAATAGATLLVSTAYLWLRYLL